MAEAKAWVMIPKMNKNKTECTLDLRPLVLCKDCKWWKNSANTRAWHPCIDMQTDKYWFCADGEKRCDTE